MPTLPRNEAVPNPLLAPFGVLVGTWRTTGTHPMVPGKTFHGRTTFAWIEGGAFLAMHSEIDEPEIPSATAVLGTDDAAGTCTMLYFDERGVSRHYAVTCEDGIIQWTRIAPNDLSQSMTLMISADGREITAQGEMSEKGGPWKPDLGLTYVRMEQPPG